MRNIADKIQVILEKRKLDYRLLPVERTKRLDAAMQNFDICFDDYVKTKVRSGVIIHFLPKKPLSKLMDLSKNVEGI